MLDGIAQYHREHYFHHVEWRAHAYSRAADRISIPHIWEVHCYSEYVCHIYHKHLFWTYADHIQYANFHGVYTEFSA